MRGGSERRFSNFLTVPLTHSLSLPRFLPVNFNNASVRDGFVLLETLNVESRKSVVALIA